MPIKRTVTKSKKDGVKKKTVTYSTGRGSVTKTKAKGKTGKAKTTTVTAKKRTNAGTKPKVVATSSKTKDNRKSTKTTSTGRVRRTAGTKKQKDVLMSDGRMVSSRKTKGPDYGRNTDRSIGGVAGKRYAEMDKTKFGGANKSKRRSSGKSVGTMKGVKKYPDHRPVSGRRTGRRR